MYEVLRILASGGPVRVELVRTDRGLVVVKRLEHFHDVLERRLMREAQVASRLDHPGIVPLAWVEDGRLAYAYAAGATLDVLLAGGPLPQARVASFVRQVLAALQHAHDAGIVHHDVKPGNLIVRGERIRLLDFGFAKDLTLASITSEDTAMGTPHYMAPEQFQGARTEPRSDLYGVAATALHMLIGRPPYESDVLRVLLRDLEPNLDRDVAAILDDPTLDPAWAAWFRRGLAFEASHRFASAVEMSAALPRLGAVPVVTLGDLAERDGPPNTGASVGVSGRSTRP